MDPEARLSRQKLATEVYLKRADQALAREQFALERARFELQRRQARQSGFRVLLSPTGVVIVGAALGLLGTAAGKYADVINTKRQQETAIILKAGEVPVSLDPEQQATQRARNLLWFSEAHYIDLPEDFVVQLRKAADLKAGEKLPAPVTQSTIDSGPDLVSRFEGFQSKASDTPIGQEVGFGHLVTPTEKRDGVIRVGDTAVPLATPLSREQARALLEKDMAPAYRAVDALVKVPLGKNQRDALASLVWNVGAERLRKSKLLDELNQRHYDAVPTELTNWRYPGGRTFPGLQARRAEEARLWSQPDK